MASFLTSSHWIVSVPDAEGSAKVKVDGFRNRMVEMYGKNLAGAFCLCVMVSCVCVFRGRRVYTQTAKQSAVASSALMTLVHSLCTRPACLVFAHGGATAWDPQITVPDACECLEYRNSSGIRSSAPTKNAKPLVVPPPPCRFPPLPRALVHICRRCCV